MSQPLDRPVLLTEEAPPPAPEDRSDRAVLIETDETHPVEPPRAGAPEDRLAGATPLADTPRRRAPWLALAGAGLLGVLLLIAVEWVMGLFAASLLLGTASAAFVALTVIGAGAWITQELRAIARLNDAGRTRALLAWQSVPTERAEMRRRIESAGKLLGRSPQYRPTVARWRTGRATDAPPADMLRLFEADLLAAADAVALAAGRRATRDAFGLIALSPTPLTDTALFVSRATRLLREVAEAYGHRPTSASLYVLTRRVLADAGIVSLGDFTSDAVANVLGGTLLAKASSMAGEGAVAAQRMARFALLATEQCRPIPFHPDREPGITDILRGAQ